MRGPNKAFCLIFILLTPALSSRRGRFFLNLMAVTETMGTTKSMTTSTPQQSHCPFQSFRILIADLDPA